MTGRTTVSVEGRPQANALFSIYAANNGIQFREVIERFVEQNLFLGIQTRKSIAGCGSAATWSRIFLSL
jgi:hypothetical protein